LIAETNTGSRTESKAIFWRITISVYTHTYRRVYQLAPTKLRRIDADYAQLSLLSQKQGYFLFIRSILLSVTHGSEMCLQAGNALPHPSESHQQSVNRRSSRPRAFKASVDDDKAPHSSPARTSIARKAARTRPAEGKRKRKL
jgi:hypothetical protein